MMIIRKTLYYRLIHLHHTRHLHYDPGSVVIASAVRTPWLQRMSQQYPSLTSTHLSASVVEAAVKQSGAPLEKVQTVYMTENPEDSIAVVNKLRFGELMKKAQHISVAHGVGVFMNTLQKVIDDLKAQKCEFVVVGGVETVTHSQHKDARLGNKETSTANSGLLKDYISQCKELHLSSSKKGIFDAELMPLRVIKQDGNKRLQVEITQDDFPEEGSGNNVEGYEEGNYVEGATALVLTTTAAAEKHNMKALVVIKDIVLQENSTQYNAKFIQDVIQSMVNTTGVPISAINHWQFNAKWHSINATQKHFHIPWEHINPYGSISTFVQTEHDNIWGILSHISHTLKPKQHGCVVSFNGSKSIAILLEKLPTISSVRSVSRLTLYTKDPCHLCDILVDELESNFAGEYNLEKVYLDTKENVRYLRLYRHDIPVLYLNGQFLCMHRLNARLLRRKLDLLKEMESV